MNFRTNPIPPWDKQFNAFITELAQIFEKQGWLWYDSPNPPKKERIRGVVLYLLAMCINDSCAATGRIEISKDSRNWYTISIQTPLSNRPKYTLSSGTAKKILERYKYEF